MHIILYMLFSVPFLRCFCLHSFRFERKIYQVKASIDFRCRKTNKFQQITNKISIFCHWILYSQHFMSYEYDKFAPTSHIPPSQWASGFSWKILLPSYRVAHYVIWKFCVSCIWAVFCFDINAFNLMDNGRRLKRHTPIYSIRSTSESWWMKFLESLFSTPILRSG